MAQKSWHLSRRTFLKGAGVSLALPLLDGMIPTMAQNAAAELPRRFCGVYFPFGVSLPPENHAARQWGWFPTGQGADFEFTRVLSSLNPVKDQVSVLGGLSHPQGRRMGGHDTGDIFLTGAELTGSQLQNSVSLDQFAAERFGPQTRFSSLTLSSDGGVGEPTRSTTLSFTRQGRPVPALSQPRRIFDRLFGNGDQTGNAQRVQLENAGSMLDGVLEHAQSLRNQLGTQDRQRLDEYLSSVREVEQRVERSQRWLTIPRPNVDVGSMNLEVTQDAPREYLRTMYDLMFLAFQTDSTRIATYMIGQVAGRTTIANAFPACIGLTGNWHGLAHGAGRAGGYERLGRFDQFLAEQLHYFINRLASTREGDGTLLDRTMILYGSSNSRTHQNRNYPLVLAGGRGLGLRHGRYHRFTERTPLSNLFVTVLDKLQVPVESFADSTGEMSEVIR